MAVQAQTQSRWIDGLRFRLASRNTRPADYVLVVIVGLLVAVGILMIYSVSVGPNLQGGRDDPFGLVERHVLALVAGAGLMVIIARLDYHWFARYTISVPMMLVTLALLVILLIFGNTVEGARRWLFGPSVQPGELAKLVTIIYVAAWLSSKGKQLRRLAYGLVPFAILVGVVAGLIILQPNYSTALIIVTVAFCMFFMAGADLIQFFGAGIIGGGVATLVVLQSDRAIERIKTLLLDPTGAVNDQSWQVVQTLVALSSGGLFGKGVGTGGGQYGYVPLAHSDGIFAIWGEETGLVGTYLLLALFVALAYRGFRIARQAPDDFGRILAAGITFWLALQAMINMAVITQLMPFTGQPLPFISFGGSSMMMSLVGIGLLLSISRARPLPPVVRSTPVGPGGARGKESESTRKNATVSYGGRNRRPRLSTRRRAPAPRRRTRPEPGA
jgi:cell division protein FtsW